jgi:hypothetical protein
LAIDGVVLIICGCAPIATTNKAPEGREFFPGVWQTPGKAPSGELRLALCAGWTGQGGTFLTWGELNPTFRMAES